MLEGERIYYYKNGGRFDGYWKNGKKKGKGIYFYINGNRYEEEWKNSLREGKEYFIIIMVIEKWEIF